jgi:hypothetical protein
MAHACGIDEQDVVIYPRVEVANAQQPYYANALPFKVAELSRKKTTRGK